MIIQKLLKIVKLACQFQKCKHIFIFSGISLNLAIDLGRIDLLTTLSVPKNKCDVTPLFRPLIFLSSVL
jgi:hypothetical protein